MSWRRDMNMWEIKYEGGGQVPNVLSGFYTSKARAQEAIDKYGSR